MWERSEATLKRGGKANNRMEYLKKSQQDDSSGDKKLPLLCAIKELWICVAYAYFRNSRCGGENALLNDLLNEKSDITLDLVIPALVPDFWMDSRWWITADEGRRRHIE